METCKNKGGRPRLETGGRTEHVVVRFTEEEDKQLSALEKELGMNRSEIIRKRVLFDAEMIVINSKSLISELDNVGAELGRAGNNINQLAHHANLLNTAGKLTPEITGKFNVLLENYISIQHDLEISLRQIIRRMNR
jgi:hypothetical protein